MIEVEERERGGEERRRKRKKDTHTEGLEEGRRKGYQNSCIPKGIHEN